MWIDTGVGRPVLSNKVGGVSGTAILPIAVRAVYEIRNNAATLVSPAPRVLAKPGT